MKDATARRLLRAKHKNLRFDASGLKSRVDAVEQHLGRFHEEQSKKIDALELRVRELEKLHGPVASIPTSTPSADTPAADRTADSSV